MEEHVFFLGCVPVSQDGQGPHVDNVSCVCTIYNATYDWLHVKSSYTHQYFVIAMLQVTSCKQVLTTVRSHHLLYACGLPDYCDILCSEGLQGEVPCRIQL